jgi:hypothetical protein
MREKKEVVVEGGRYFFSSKNSFIKNIIEWSESYDRCWHSVLFLRPQRRIKAMMLRRSDDEYVSSEGMGCGRQGSEPEDGEGGRQMRCLHECWVQQGFWLQVSVLDLFRSNLFASLLH